LAENAASIDSNNAADYEFCNKPSKNICAIIFLHFPLKKDRVSNGTSMIFIEEI
jgi:hypothetical protein